MWTMRRGARESIILAMTPPVSSEKLMLVPGRNGAETPGSDMVVRRFRLARLHRAAERSGGAGSASVPAAD